MANRFQLWGQAGWASAEVVGETHYAKAIRALFGPDFDPQGTDITVPLQLIPDRNNRHDRNAVGVWSGQSLLGHLPRPEAARYVTVLTSLTARGLIPEVTARIHGREWGEYDGRPPAFVGTIRLDLAEPHMLVPANDPPTSEHRLLPSGSAVQVTGQQQFLEALRPLLRPEGECWAYVTLHEMADHLVEVRIGDARVGDLSPKMSGELLPILRHLSEQGLVTAARAIVKGNAGEASVMLYIARAQDLPESWQGRPLTTSFPVSPAASPTGHPHPAGAVSTSGAYPAASGALAGSSGGHPAAAKSGALPSADVSSSGLPSSSSGAFPATRSGRAASGAASTGPAVPGPAGGIAPTWTPPGEPAAGWADSGETAPGWAGSADLVPSWAARDDASQSWTPSASGDTAAGWTPGGTGLRLGIASDAGLGRLNSENTSRRPAGPGDMSARGRDAGAARDAGPDPDPAPDAGPAADAAGSAPGRAASGEIVPSWAASDEAVPSWAASDEAVPSWAASNEAVPSWAASDEAVPSWAASDEAVPSWAAPNENTAGRGGAGEGLPGWAAPGEAVPSWALPGTGVPAWANPSASALPTLPSTGSLPGGAAPRLDQPDDATPPRTDTAGKPLAPSAGLPSPAGGTSVSSLEGQAPGLPSPVGGPSVSPPEAQAAVAPQPAGPSPLERQAPLSPTAGPPAPGQPASPVPAQALPASPSSSPPTSGATVAGHHATDSFANPVSPAPSGAGIAETTVLPALAAVVKSNASRISGATPVPAAPEANPHPPIPGAPTGIKFVVPPGWPVPPDGWYPPDGWRPDPGWPLAPPGWQWWVPVWD